MACNKWNYYLNMYLLYRSSEQYCSHDYGTPWVLCNRIYSYNFYLFSRTPKLGLCVNMHRLNESDILYGGAVTIIVNQITIQSRITELD